MMMVVVVIVRRDVSMLVKVGVDPVKVIVKVLRRH